MPQRILTQMVKEVITRLLIHVTTLMQFIGPFCKMQKSQYVNVASVFLLKEVKAGSQWIWNSYSRVI